MIFWKYITVILAFCNHYIFSPAFVYTFFHVVQLWALGNNELRATNKLEIFDPVGKNSIKSTWNTSASVWKCCTHVLIGTRGSKRYARRWMKDDSWSGRPSTSKIEVNVKQVWQMVIVWRIACQLDMTKECLEDYHQRFGHMERLCKNGAETIQWWSEGAPRAGVSRHYRVFSNQIRFASLSHHWLWDVDFWVRPRSLWCHQGQKKQDNQSHVKHVLQCKGNFSS